MACVASRVRALPRVRPLPPSFVLPALVLLGPVRGLVLPAHASLGESLWMDEGLSIGIASQPLFDIPHVLRVDGSPPLYYMLLSVWMDVLRQRAGRHAEPVDGDRAARHPQRAVGGLEPLRPPRRPDLRGALRGQPVPHHVRAGDAHVLAHAGPVAAHHRRLPARVRATAGAATCRRSRCSWRCWCTRTTGACSWPSGCVCALVPCWYVSEVRSSFWRDALIGFGVAGVLYLPVGADAPPPDPAHRRALAQLAQLRRADPDHAVAARRRHARRSRWCWRAARASPRSIARRVEDQRAHRRARRRTVTGSPRSRSPGSCRRSRPPGPRATSASCSARCC